MTLPFRLWLQGGVIPDSAPLERATRSDPSDQPISSATCREVRNGSSGIRTGLVTLAVGNEVYSLGDIAL